MLRRSSICPAVTYATATSLHVRAIDWRPGSSSVAPESTHSSPEGIDEVASLPGPRQGWGPAPDGTGWSLPPGGPFLRTDRSPWGRAKRREVRLAGSSDRHGVAAVPPPPASAEARIAVLNRGIAGNRILSMHHGRPHRGAGPGCLDSMRTCSERTASRTWSSPTTATDWGLPGRIYPPSRRDAIARSADPGLHQETRRSEPTRGTSVDPRHHHATRPELADDPLREGFRLAMNEWIRTSGGRLRGP